MSLSSLGFTVFPESKNVNLWFCKMLCSFLCKYCLCPILYSCQNSFLYPPCLSTHILFSSFCAIFWVISSGLSSTSQILSSAALNLFNLSTTILVSMTTSFISTNFLVLFFKTTQLFLKGTCSYYQPFISWNSSKHTILLILKSLWVWLFCLLFCFFFAHGMCFLECLMIMRYIFLGTLWEFFQAWVEMCCSREKLHLTLLPGKIWK